MTAAVPTRSTMHWRLPARNSTVTTGLLHFLAYYSPILTRILVRPDYTNTEPTTQIGPFPQWYGQDKIVAMDPWGHLAPWIFKDLIGKENSTISPLHSRSRLLIRLVSRYPTYHCHHQSPHEGEYTTQFVFVTKIVANLQNSCQNSKRVSNQDACLFHPSDRPTAWTLIIPRVPDGKVCLNELGEVAVTKFAVEPVSKLPGTVTSGA